MGNGLAGRFIYFGRQKTYAGVVSKEVCFSGDRFAAGYSIHLRSGGAAGPCPDDGGRSGGSGNIVWRVCFARAAGNQAGSGKFFADGFCDGSWRSGDVTGEQAERILQGDPLLYGRADDAQC